jgi:DNA-binding CsgD family transcriptional regulator
MSARSNHSLTGVLTVKQAEALRLASEHRSSKEIARIVGITRYAVDHRIKEALRNLGAGTRAEGVRMYLQLTESDRDQIACDSAEVDLPAFTGFMGGLDAQGDLGASRSHNVLHDASGYLPFDGEAFETDIWPGSVSVSTGNDLGTAMRILVIAGLSIGFVLAFVLLIGATEILSRLV